MNLVRGSTYANSAHYRGRVSVFETSPICPDCVIFVGAVGGSIIGTAVVPFHTRLSRRGTTLIGLWVTMLIVLIVYLVFGQSMYDPHENSFISYILYLFWFVGTSIMAILGLTWVAGQCSVSSNSHPSICQREMSPKPPHPQSTPSANHYVRPVAP